MHMHILIYLLQLVIFFSSFDYELSGTYDYDFNYMGATNEKQATQNQKHIKRVVSVHFVPKSS